MVFRRPMILLLGFTALTFIGTCTFQFVYDDNLQIVENPHVQAWHFAPSYFTRHVWAQDPDAPHQYYRPLFLLILRLLHAVFGLWSPGWHFALVLCHVGAVACVYWLVQQWKSPQTALTAAALFALHPVHAEVVSWVSAIGEPCLLIVLIGSLVLVRRPGTWNLVAASVLYALGLLLKETAVIWPFVIFVVLYEDLGRTIRRTLPFWGITAAYLLIRAAVLGDVVVSANDRSTPDFALIPTALGHYFFHLVWPVKLSEFYFLHASWMYLVVVIPVLAGLIWVAGEGQYQRTAVLILLLPLVPVLNLKALRSESLLQDRYLYIPSVGFVMLIAPLLKLVPKPAVAILMLAMIAGCIRESKTWSDSEHLYGRALELSPTDQRARDGLARAYAKQGRYGEAINILEPLVKEPQPSARRLQQSFMTLAYSHEQMGHSEQALAYYTAADNLYPRPDIEQHIRALQAAPASSR
ncbi:MAG: tetratricopeptide repeat protein [Terriglobales bacterium]|jgi:hypothetical protein